MENVYNVLHHRIPVDVLCHPMFVRAKGLGRMLESVHKQTMLCAQVLAQSGTDFEGDCFSVLLPAVEHIDASTAHVR
jgi:hypothetical protein